MKNSVSAPMKVNPTISLMDEDRSMFHDRITAQGVSVHDKQFHGIYISHMIIDPTLKKRDLI